MDLTPSLVEHPDPVIALTARLIATDTVNPGLVPGAVGERAAVELLADRLAVAGLATRVVEAPGHVDRPSLLAWTPDVRECTVLLNGHLDTVGVEGMPEPFTPHLEGGRLTGRGACDMKGGVAALVATAEALAGDPEAPRIVLALVADEEDRSVGTEAILPVLAELGLVPDVALVAEPSGLALTLSHRGYAVTEVLLTGRAAHSSLPELGVNAAHHAAAVVAAVIARAPSVAAAGGALMVTAIDAGRAPFTIPERARVLVERRTVPLERSADALAEVQNLLDEVALTQPDMVATARLVNAREAWWLDEVGPAADLAGLLARTLGISADAPGFAAPYWMESALFQAAGIPAVVCGPGGGGMHAVDEWLDVDQLSAYAAALPAALLAFAASRRAH